MVTATLTDKERQMRGLDALGSGVRPLVDERMTLAAHGTPWVPLYEAKESARLGRPYRGDADDPRLLLRILRYERRVFTEIDASQRAWIDELIQSSNRAAHASSVTRSEADRALDTMALLAESLGLDDVISELTALQVMRSVSKPLARRVAEAQLDTPTGEAESLPPPAEDDHAAELDVPAPRTAERVPVEGFPSVGIRVLSARTGELDIVVLYREAVNYALVHNRVSPIAAVRVRNNGLLPVENVDLTIEMETPPALSASPVASPLVVSVGTIDAGDEFEIPAHQLVWRLSPASFITLDEAVVTGIHLTVSTGSDGDSVVVRDTAGVRLLTAEEWWALGIPEGLAAFVRPNDPAVVTLLTEASALLVARTGSPALEGYQSGPERVHRIAEAIYDAMAARRITYVEAPSSFEDTGQRIRSHAQVLEDKRGTCLDLACTYAAALEQAGINPVIAVVKGHAFTGYLTEETELPTVALTDQGAIVTVADSDVFDAVETTALCDGEEAVSFDQARGLVRRWWRSELDKVAYLLDIQAAHRRVKPLPSIRVEGGVRVVEVVREHVQAPLRRVPAATTTARGAREKTVPPRVERWQRALLDMTYMNPLLKLKKASSTPVHIPAGGLARLEDKIADGHHIQLVAHDQLAAIHAAQGARTAADVDADALRRIMDEESTLFVSFAQSEYAARLRNMQRRARTTLEETGTDSLYLALGTLEWSEGAREGRAPLFLAPVRLTGGRGGTRFGIELDDSRAMEPNYCLVEKLRVTWGLEIPELTDPGEDESGIDVANALAAVRSALLRAKTETFRVEETAHLALLQFSTLEMWRDLQQNWARFMDRPAVKHLVETPGQPFLDGIEPPGPDPTAEATTYLPIPADGSQIEAVRWAAAGKSFILEGPPGTGKSQTITNLVAHCLAEGKKVLFVAEKQAALDVVKKRLDEVGLGPLSLDLHGKNQTVTAVRQQISDALDVAVLASSSWETLQSGYESLVNSLSRYPSQLHEMGPVDMSAWDARQVILELEERTTATALSLAVPRGLVMGGTPVSDVYDAARDLANALLNLGVIPDQSPWQLAGPLDPAALDRNAVVQALHELREAEAALVDPGVRTATAIARTSAELGAIADWLDTVDASVGRSTGEAAHVVTPAWRRYAQQFRDTVAHFRESQGGRLGDFLPHVLDLDLESLVNRSVEADGRMFGRKKRRLAILADLQVAMRGPESFPLKGLTAVLRGLLALRDEMRGLVQHVATLPGVALPYGWNPLDDQQAGTLDHAIQGLVAAANLRAVIGIGRSDVERARSTVDRVTTEALSMSPLAVASGEAVRRLDKAWCIFRGLLGSTDADYARWLGSRTRGEAIVEDAQTWLADASGGALIRLQRWLRVRSALAKLETFGLGSLIEPVRTGALRGSEVESSVRLAVAWAVLNERLDSTGLAGFDGSERAGLLKRFLDSGQDVRKRLVVELPARIVRARTFDPAARTGMVSDLRQQLGRRRGGMSARRLLHHFGSLITQITPCFLMSPSSVARFLPADAIDFDVVVFDEASQIRVPEAIGAMGRGRSVVIVGDSKQMPPSSMFAASGPNEDDEEDLGDESLPVPVDLESILSEGVESRLPQLLLTWHYRSRDESLIAFSNSQYYEGRLSSFPTPPVHGKVPALHLRRVDGAWEGGGRSAARINRAEAAAVVEDIQSRLARRPEQSIGVVTFNTRQRDHILDLLDDVRQRDERVEEALLRKNEPLFVKNLENVQGDERDTILFTLAFAADARGKVPLNWGPLSRAGGERRLNVAVTRAKEQVVVFCSFEPHELDLSRSSSQGLADLKDYLLAARNGVESAGLRRAEARDLHLEDIEKALRGSDLEVRTHVGLSDFTVDLAVRTGADKPWIAVMLDGPGWAARSSVGDRDGLPATVLIDRMGWSRVERIWMPTWLLNRESVLKRIETAAAEAHERELEPAPVDVPNVPQAPASGTGVSAQPPSPSMREPDMVTSGPELGVAATNDVLPPVAELVRSAVATAAIQTATVSHPVGQPRFVSASTAVCHSAWMLDDQTRTAMAAIRDELIDVVRSEGPVMGERLARIVAARFGLSRVRESRREQILARAPRGLARKARNGDLVYWPEGADPDAYTAFRLPEDKRDIADVPYQELRNAMVDVVRGAHGMGRDDTLRETARVFGVVRLGANVRERLEGVLAATMAEGLLTERDGLVSEG